MRSPRDETRSPGASGSSGANGVPYAAGTSHRCHLTYFDRSDRSGFGPRRPACGPALAHVAAGDSEPGHAPAVASSAAVAGVVGYDGCNALATPRKRNRGFPGTAGRGRPSLGVFGRGRVAMGSAGRGQARRGMDAPRRGSVAGAISGLAGRGVVWRGQAGQGTARFRRRPRGRKSPAALHPWRGMAGTDEARLGLARSGQERHGPALPPRTAGAVRRRFRSWRHRASPGMPRRGEVRLGLAWRVAAWRAPVRNGSPLRVEASRGH